MDRSIIVQVRRSLVPGFILSFMFAVALYAAPGSDLALTDLQWSEKAARLEAGEVWAGRLAAQQAGSVEVRDFGEGLAVRHGKAGQELQALAASKGALLPNQPDHAHRRLLTKLAGLKGEHFDSQYLADAGAKDHEYAIRLYESGVGKLKDPDLKAYAERTLPMLKQDYDATYDVKRAVDHA